MQRIKALRELAAEKEKRIQKLEEIIEIQEKLIKEIKNRP